MATGRQRGHNSNNSASSINVTLTLPTIAGNLLVGLAWQSDGGTPAVSDGTNSWQQAPVGPGANGLFIFYVLSTAAGISTVTITASGGTPGLGLTVYEVTPVASPAALSDQDNGTGTSTTLTTKVLSLGTSEGFVAAIGVTGDGSAFGAGTGYTAFTDWSAGTNLGDEFHDGISASEAATATETASSGTYQLTAAMFRFGAVTSGYLLVKN